MTVELGEGVGRLGSGWKESGEASWRRRAGVGGSVVQDAGRAQDSFSLGPGRSFSKELKRKKPRLPTQGGSTSEGASRAHATPDARGTPPRTPGP